MKKSISLILLLSLYLFSNAQQLSWLQLPDFPGGGRLGPSSFSINGKGYMGLGLDSTSQGKTDWYEYDPGTNLWTQKANLPAAGRWTCVSFTIGSKGYVITGSTNNGLSNETWEYDPSANTWTSKLNFPGSARQNAAGFVIGSNGYVGTGYNGSISLTDFYEFEPANNIWISKASFPGPDRNGAAGLSIGSKGYIGLGNSTGSTSNFRDFYEYDTTSNSWSQKADYPIQFIVTPCTYSGMSDGFILCGYYYQGTGITHNPINTLYKYDQSINTWSLAGTFIGLPRGYAGGFSFGNDIYMGSGSQKNDLSPHSLLHDFWKLGNGLTLMTTNPTTDNVDFNIYPNPSGRSITISSEMKEKKPEHLRLYDENGKLINTYQIIDIEQSIDVSSLSKGIYFVELVTGKGEVFDSRFLKE